MDSRNWNRHLVDKDVTCSITGVEGRGFVYDLSAGGCMIELHDLQRMIGSPITLDIYGPEPTTGTVVWQWRQCVGVCFDAVLHEAVVRHIGFTPPTVPFEEQVHRDRFGRVLPPLEAAGRRQYGKTAGAASAMF